ncbi:MAG TPA: acyltransferase [Usitatibacter sp.]|jgi:peptidoglycan/LPS O-acetylase OafA/YrhL|nr:acyltransferase [Usitatibacter sp.]
MREGVRAEVGDIPVLDGLRGIAVIWVVAFHFVVLREGDAWVEALHAMPALDALVRNGYLGVDLFFLLSGFLLALPWLAHANAGLPPPSAKAFYVRRARRILPAYYVQLVLLFLVALPLLLGRSYWRRDLYVYLWNGVAHGLFLQGTSPLTSGSMGINGALWTLPIEVQFYLLLPLVVAFFIRAPRRALAAAIAISLGWQWAAAHGLGPLVGLELRLGEHWHWPEATVREMLSAQLPAFLGHFALGIVLARAWLARRHGSAPMAAPFAALAGAALLAVSVAGLVPLPPEHIRLVPSAGLTLLFYAAVTSRARPVALALGRGPLTLAGRISYSAYLCHLPILAVWNTRPSIFGGWLSLPGYALVVFTVSWVSWRWIEQPFLRVRRAIARGSANAPLSGATDPDSPATGIPR